MCYHSDLAHPLSDHTMISHFRSHDPDPTLNSRCIKYSRSYHNHSPCNIKYTSDRSIPQNLIACTLGLMMFSSLYTLRPFTIPWTKTTQDQYLGPNTQGQYLGPNTLDQYHGSKYLGPNTTDQKLSFPTYTRFSFCESACVCIRECVKLTCVYMQLGQ